MIALLRGALIEKHPNQAIIDAAGVGYDVTIPVSTFSSLPDVGDVVTLRIHTHVREDALLLFGFATKEEKTVFEKLTSVSGIGPKLAITVLSGLAVADLTAAIRAGQVEKLVRIPGVGKKTAERMILELRDKLEGAVATSASSTPAATASDIDLDVISALVNLGCNRPIAEAAIQKAKAAGAPQQFELLFRRSMEFIR